MTGKEVLAADAAGPLGGIGPVEGTNGTQLTVVTLDTGSNAYDLSAPEYFNGTAYYAGNFVELDCDTAVYFFWSDNELDAVDETSADGTGRETQCARLLANQPKQHKPRGRYLIAKPASGNPLLRITITNTVAVK